MNHDLRDQLPVAADDTRAASASSSAAVLTAELARTRAALRELYRVFVICPEGPVTLPFRQAAIREAGEVLGHR